MESRVAGIPAVSRKVSALGVVMVALPGSLVGCSGSPDAEDPTAITANVIVAASAQAMDVRAVSTLRLVIEYPDHDYLVTSEVARPGRIWSGAEGVYAMGFDGAVAWYHDYRPGPAGEAQELERVAEQYLGDFEVDIAYYFPAYFDYPSEYVGDDTLEDGDAFVLAVDLPLGARVQYWVDKMSHLPVKVRSTVTIDGETHEVERTMSDFHRIDGLMYPRSFTYPGRDGEPMAGSFVSVEVNVPLDEARFAYPEGA
jgi:hypothetical protein